jgi:hypothetical protein
MARFMGISRLHWLVVFVMAGVFAAAFAFSTYNLFHLSMANLDFLRQYGLLAIQEGALGQTIEIAAGGAVALFFFLGFKVCERELVTRYFDWSSSDE